jgi:M6 family metalloprotease-like protein
MGLDTTSYYRLTNSFLGRGQALDVKPDGSGHLMMAPSADVTGQLWRLVDLGGGRYALRTEYLGDGFSLDVINDGANITPWLAVTGNLSGQFWTLSPLNDGTYKLTNLFTGPDKSLDTYRDTHAPFLDVGDHSGQHWTLTPVSSVVATTPIPALDPKGSVYKTEGPTDFTFYQRPVGAVRAAMIFVDFANAPADADAAGVAAHLLGGGAAQQLYRDQSYQKLQLDVTVLSALGWRRMRSPSTNYTFTTFASQKAYITDACSLFSLSEVDFSAYSLVLVVAPRGAGFGLSPAFNAPPGDGATTPSGTVRLGVTFGTDSYTNRYINLVHEVGHCFGLPDLYPLPDTGVANWKVGCWDIMSDIFHCVSFLGWHRHKNTWLDPPRTTYLSGSTSAWYTTLSPLSGSDGRSMVVLPIDDVARPSKVFVIELAQPVLGTNGEPWGDGVLLYTVDATLPTGASPVVVMPKIDTGVSPYYGPLYQAPYGVGDSVTITMLDVTLTLSVLQRFGSSYNIKIEYQRG